MSTTQEMSFPAHVELAHALSFSARLEDMFTLKVVPAWVRARRLDIAETILSCTFTALSVA